MKNPLFYNPPEPNCPECHLGNMLEWDDYDPEHEVHTRFIGCDRCGYWFNEYGQSGFYEKESNAKQK